MRGRGRGERQEGGSGGKGSEETREGCEGTREGSEGGTPKQAWTNRKQLTNKLTTALHTLTPQPRPHTRTLTLGTMGKTSRNAHGGHERTFWNPTSTGVAGPPSAGGVRSLISTNSDVNSRSLSIPARRSRNSAVKSRPLHALKRAGTRIYSRPTYQHN